MVNKVTSKARKTNVMVMLEPGEIEFLDKQISRRDPEKKSRSAILRLLVHRAMIRPKLLDTSWTCRGE